jgi:GNAT superfamily N-acetyltransferase
MIVGSALLPFRGDESVAEILYSEIAHGVFANPGQASEIITAGFPYLLAALIAGRHALRAARRERTVEIDVVVVVASVGAALAAAVFVFVILGLGGLEEHWLVAWTVCCAIALPVVLLTLSWRWRRRGIASDLLEAIGGGIIAWWAGDLLGFSIEGSSISLDRSGNLLLVLFAPGLLIAQAGVIVTKLRTTSRSS